MNVLEAWTVVILKQHVTILQEVTTALATLDSRAMESLAQVSAVDF